MKLNRLSVSSLGMFLCLCLLSLSLADGSWAEMGVSRFVQSKDGTPISYQEFGTGDPTLVLVHGWSCDSRYWRAQIPEMSRRYHVITLDLAGHGHSGLNRGRYSMERFGEDVKAVVEASTSGPVILVGHSMGGAVIAEAARLMPDQVIGLIGVDTLHNIERPMTRIEIDRLLSPFADNFLVETRKFIGNFLLPGDDPGLREWILADMSAAPPWVGISALEELLGQSVSGRAARNFDMIRAPVICINGDSHPVDFAANRRHMRSFEVIELKGADHFLMLTRPNAFNKALEQAVPRILRQVIQQ